MTCTTVFLQEMTDAAGSMKQVCLVLIVMISILISSSSGAVVLPPPPAPTATQFSVSNEDPYSDLVWYGAVMDRDGFSYTATIGNSLWGYTSAGDSDFYIQSRYLDGSVWWQLQAGSAGSDRLYWHNYYNNPLCVDFGIDPQTGTSIRTPALFLTGQTLNGVWDGQTADAAGDLVVS
jgi:hypothetical protein